MATNATGDKPPATLAELESQLEGSDVPPVRDPDAPPHPRESSSLASHDPLLEPEPEQISDATLEAAVIEADRTEQPEDSRPLDDKKLHVERDPNAPKTPFWKRKRFWFSLLLLLVLGLALAWFIRPSRWFLVNSLGFRAEITINTATLAEAGKLPALLKNVAIEVDGKTVTTDDQGVARATVRYGNITAVAKKPGYADVTKTAIVDYDPFFYALGGKQQDQQSRTFDLQFEVVGVPLQFKVVDWLTNNPLITGNFSVGDTVARPDQNGTVTLTLPATDDKMVVVKAGFGGSYNDRQVEVPLDGTTQTLSFVPAGRDYFISSRNSGLAVIACDIDGSNQVELVTASPNETGAIAIAPSPNGKFVALASTRNQKRDAQGNLLQELFVVDVATKKLTATDQALWFNFVDWSGDTLVYTAGEFQPKASEATQRLASLNVTNNNRVNLGTATFYGVIRVAFGNVAYQIGYRQNQEGAENGPELRTVPVGGGTEKHLGSKVQQIVQADLERMAYQSADNTWHEYNLNTSQSKNISTPSNPGRAYMATASADGQTRLIVDLIDGKPTLVARNVGNGQERQLFGDATIRGPIRLVGTVVIFRMGSADYAVSLTGGAPKKIIDVTRSIAPFPQPTYVTFF